MADLVATIGADISDLKAGMSQAQSVIIQTADSAESSLNRIGNSANSASMQMMQMRSGMSAARDGVLAFTLSGQGAERSLMAMGHHFTSLINETGSVGGAMSALGSSLMGPGGIILGLTLAMTLFEKFGKSEKDAEDSTKSYVETLHSVRAAELEGEQNGQKEIVRLGILYNATQDHTLSLKQRNQAYDELVSKYPNYFTNAERENTLLGKNVTAYNDLTAAILSAANAKAAEDKIGSNSSRKLEDQFRIADELKKQGDLKKTIQEEQAKMDDNDSFSSAGLSKTQTMTQRAAVDDLIASQKRLNDLKADQGVLDKQNADLAKIALDNEAKAGFKTEGKEQNGKTTKKDTSVEELTIEGHLTYSEEEIKKDADKLKTFINQELKSAGGEGLKTDGIQLSLPDFVKTDKDMAKFINDYQTLQALKAKATKTQAQLTAQTNNENMIATDGVKALDAGFQSLMQTGKFSFSAVAQEIDKMIEKLIIAVAEALAFATIMSLLSGGTTTIMKAFLGSGGSLAKMTGIQVPGFATGGIVSGPTLAMVGEGKESEAIMPLSKLQNFVNANQGGGGGTLQTKISGADLLVWVDRATKQKGRLT